MHALPTFSDIAAYHAWRAEPSRWLPAALDIARGHGLPHGDPHPFRTGTNLVVALDEKLILKIFPPLLRAQFVSERASLSQLRGRLGIAVPEIVTEGERDGWPYLVITRLPGVLGSEAWPGMPEPDKQRVLRQEFKAFVNTFVTIPCQVLRTSRRLVLRVLAWNPYLMTFFRLVSRLRQ